MNATTTHECPAEGCGRRVPYEMLACSVHYRQLPRDVRNRLYRTWANGRGAGTDQHQAAVQACRDVWDGV